ncbi:MAG TPA: chemotaxis protein CheA [Vicinamibacterales bacterium]|jgi:two-component system chemotaxis sensor kinase CheA
MHIDRAELIQIFSAESEENLREMELGYVQLESTPDDVETLQAIFRAAHTIKGNAASLGFPALARFAHGVEDVLDQLRTGATALTTPLATLLLRTVDVFRYLIDGAVAGSTEDLLPEHHELLDDLKIEAGGHETVAVPAATQDHSDRRSGEDRRVEGERRHRSKAQTLRVEIDKLDRMLNLTGEIAVARERLTGLLDSSDGSQLIDEILEAHRSADRLFMDLQEEVMKVRMVPLGPTFRQFVRTVRDVATAQGKHATVDVSGEDVGVDMNVIEHLRDPLTHIVRNAVDHGIETPDERRQAGKDPRGRILLQAWHEGGSIVIQVQDDGSGLDRGKIIERARSMGYGADLDKLSDSEVYRLILDAGFSTAPTVTEYSGRGVGMDVVRRNVEQLRGSIAIDSRLGAGTTFTLRLPLTLAIIRGFAVGVEGETYVMPLDAVIECIEFPRVDISDAGNRGFINLRGQALPYLRLRECFRLGGQRPERENVLVLRVQEQRVGLVVDRLFGESQTVIKPLGRVLGELPGVSGSAILGNGRVALILDVEGLLREALRTDVADHGMPVPTSQSGWTRDGSMSDGPRA